MFKHQQGSYVNKNFHPFENRYRHGFNEIKHHRKNWLSQGEYSAHKTPKGFLIGLVYCSHIFEHQLATRKIVARLRKPFNLLFLH